MKMIQRYTILGFTALALLSCGTAQLNKTLDEKLAREPEVVTRQDLDAKTARLAANTPGLTPAQRDRLVAIKAEVRKKLSENNAESVRLRSLLLKDVLSPGNNTREVAALKTRLRALSDKRLEMIFDAVGQTNDLLGRTELIRESMDLQEMQDATDNF